MERPAYLNERKMDSCFRRNDKSPNDFFAGTTIGLECHFGLDPESKLKKLDSYSPLSRGQASQE